MSMSKWFTMLSFALLFICGTRASEKYEFTTLVLDSFGGIRIISPDGASIPFRGKTTEKADSQAFNLNAAINALGKEGYDFAGTVSSNQVIMRRKTSAAFAATDARDLVEVAQPTAAQMVQARRRAVAALLTTPSDGHWIDSVIDSGKILKLEDGSLWEVSPLDQIDSALWLPTSDITILDGDDPAHPFRLVNKDDGEVVNAKLLKR